MNRILSSPQITPSPPTDEPSFTMATGSHSYAPNTGEMGMRKKSKDQGYYRGERRWESNIPEADAAGMGFTGGARCEDKVGDMVRFPRERMGNK